MVGVLLDPVYVFRRDFNKQVWVCDFLEGTWTLNFLRFTQGFIQVSILKAKINLYRDDKSERYQSNTYIELLALEVTRDRLAFRPGLVPDLCLFTDSPRLVFLCCFGEQFLP